ncbi:MAG: Tar ligand binding domain-containing protein, partial [Rhodoferax sp.]
MFSNIRLTQRLWLIVIAYWVALAAVMGVSAWGLNSARDSLNRVHDDRMVSSNQLADMAELLSANRMQVLLTFQHDPSGMLFSAHDHPVDSHLDAIAKNRDEITRIWGNYKARPKSPEETTLATDTETKRAAWLVKLGQVVQAMKSGNFDPGVMVKYLQASGLEGEQAVKSMAILRVFQEKEADRETKTANSRYQTSLIVFALAILLGAVPATLLTLMLLRRMKTGFALAHSTVAAIAKGDLSQPVPASGGDEIGQMLGQMATMRDNLHRLIGQVRSGAESIASATSQVASGTEDLSNRTEQQASTLEVTASASEELSSTVQHNAESAQQASQLASSASSVAVHGGTVVAQVVATMEAINHS